MKIRYRERHYIGDYRCIDTEHVIYLQKCWNIGGLLYGYKDRFNVVAIAMEDVLEIVED